jgi:threonine 3-dehydrogenase|tara:strand:+ start:3856 stop:4881 length:1026 start_codon:yes stop_codon:yes gene_type:complete
MKALVKDKAEVGLKLKEVDVPKIKADEVLIKVKATAICGTDIHIWNWDAWASKTIKPPMTVGHEFMGEIVDVGSSVKNLSLGDRVSAESHIVGSTSRNARSGKLHLDPDTINVGVNRDGAFAEFLCVPSRNVIKLPGSVDNEMGAILDPYGNAVHAALSFDLVGEDVLITGAGPIGIMSAAIALHVGARKVLITDINDDRLSLAKSVCDVETLNPSKENLKEKMKHMGLKEGFDIGLEMSGSESALDQMIDSMLMGGKVALLGLPSDSINLDLPKLIFKALTLKAIYGREMFETWYKGLALIESGLDVTNVITHSFHFTEYEKAFELLNAGKAGKVVLNWD